MCVCVYTIASLITYKKPLSPTESPMVKKFKIGVSSDSIKLTASNQNLYTSPLCLVDAKPENLQAQPISLFMSFSFHLSYFLIVHNICTSFIPSFIHHLPNLYEEEGTEIHISQTPVIAQICIQSSNNMPPPRHAHMRTLPP
jgi:hypothetical protein